MNRSEAVCIYSLLININYLNVFPSSVLQENTNISYNKLWVVFVRILQRQNKICYLGELGHFFNYQVQEPTRNNRKYYYFVVCLQRLKCFKQNFWEELHEENLDCTFVQTCKLLDLLILHRECIFCRIQNLNHSANHFKYQSLFPICLLFVFFLLSNQFRRLLLIVEIKT